MSKRWCLGLIGLLLGCSVGKLGRSTAAKQIRTHFEHNESVMAVPIGKFGLHCYGKEDLDELSSDLLSTVVALKLGYVEGPPSDGLSWTTTLTYKGRRAEDSSWQASDTSHKQFKNCDYRHTAFVVARPDLARVTGISGDEKEPDVDFEWHWVATELGAALRQNGVAYTQLDPLQKATLSSILHAGAAVNLTVPIPVPAEGETKKETAKFKKYDDGWRAE
jgi:hypothetical protein